MIPDLYGVVDLIVEFKVSWIQFLEGLGFTYLDQNPEEKQNLNEMHNPGPARFA